MSLVSASFSKRRKQSVAAVLCILLTVPLCLTGCTRNDFAAAVSELATELRATLVPFGQTAKGEVEALRTQVPVAFATAKAPVATGPAEDNLPTATLLPSPQSTPTDGLTATPQPTLTPTLPPTATLEPTETATIAPTVTPTESIAPSTIEVPQGTMVLVAGGSFQMGAESVALTAECNMFRDGCQPDWFIASEPIHNVELDRYYIDIHEVTNAAYVDFLLAIGSDALCQGRPCINTNESHLILQNGAYSVYGYLETRPVAGVTWFGASAYCEWRGTRLPTEAEWEKAASWNDAESIARRYPWGDTFDGRLVNFCDAACTAEQANPYYFDGYGETSPVAYFEQGRSAYGLYDMAGNVWEWVADWYDPNYYANSPGSNPAGPDTGVDKVVRGGSWFDTGNFTASAIRFPSPPENSDSTIGFRCAAEVR